MAKQYVVELTDDIDGTIIAEGTGESIDFSVDGVDYSIDLKGKNASEFRRTLDYYIGYAERVGGRKRRRTSPATSSPATATSVATKRDPAQSKAIREWAGAQGYTVSARGRIPADVAEAYDAAN